MLRALSWLACRTECSCHLLARKCLSVTDVLRSSSQIKPTVPHRFEGQQVPFVQYVVCLAVVAALDAAFAHRLGAFASPSDFPFRIKWPNDIYARQHGVDVKVGGILCQSLAMQGRFDLVVGLGLNVDNDEPTTSVNRVLKFTADAKGRACDVVTRGELLATVLNHLEDLVSVRAHKVSVLKLHVHCSSSGILMISSRRVVQVVETEGFASLERTYRRYWLHEGQRLQLHEDLAGGGDVRAHRSPALGSRALD